MSETSGVVLVSIGKDTDSTKPGSFDTSELQESAGISKNDFELFVEEEEVVNGWAVMRVFGDDWKVLLDVLVGQSSSTEIFASIEDGYAEHYFVLTQHEHNVESHDPESAETDEGAQPIETWLNKIPADLRSVVSSYL